MTDPSSIIDPSLDVELESNEGWHEFPRSEALKRIEQMLTIDLVAFEIEHTVDVLPVGAIETFTWFSLDDQGNQRAVLLSLREPNRDEVRWFIQSDLVQD